MMQTRNDRPIWPDDPAPRVRPAGALWVALGLTAAMACQDRPAMVRAMEARQRVTEVAAAFARTNDATNRAVMATTDEASQAAAAAARQASDDVQRGLDAMLPLVRGLSYQPELQQLESFRSRFAEYRAIEAQILDLAVENTNLKAQRLAFGTAATQADAVVGALMAATAVAPDDWRARALAGEVTTAVRTLQALQAPHIAEPDDRAMTQIEQRMQTAEADARRALQALGTAVPARGRPSVAAAGQAFDAFAASHRDILALSRRNTNVRSLALALNDKGKLALACDEALGAVAVGLESRVSYGSR